MSHKYHNNNDYGSTSFLQSLLLSLFITTTTLFINGTQASHDIYYNLQSVEAENVWQLHRTGYHFQPKQNWINDPNAPMYYKGIYHLFYQYNPKGAVWGNIVWAHSVSTDLINWKPLEPAIVPSKPFDKYGCWSGSATILPGDKPVILYTGITEGPPKNVQVQNYAIPANLSDPYLREWIKPDNNPLVVANNGENATAFRDPTTAWLSKSGYWKMLVGSRDNNTGIAYLYKSKDFVNWTKTKDPIHSKPETGMWECPDFFPVSLSGVNGLDASVTGENVKHVLKVSLDVTRYEYYTVGTYDTEQDKYIPDNTSIDGWAGLRLDYGNFYASKSFFDPAKNRRVIWSWANESDTAEHDVKKGWAGIQLIPRTMLLDPSRKQLMQWPVEELEKLRGKKVTLPEKQILVTGHRVEVKGITAAQADVEVIFSFGSLEKAEPFDSEWLEYDAQKICSLKGSTVQGGVGPFGLITLASEKLEEYTPVFFRVFKAQNTHKVLMCSDATRSLLDSYMEKKSSLMEGLYRPSFAGFVDVDIAADKKISLRSLIDNSVVESFGARGRTCISSRVYPTLAVYDDAHLYVFNNGSETITVENLAAWSMKKPLQMN